jgi:predicted component of type VI protein secretion system
VSDKLLNHAKHSKHALLHLLDLGIPPLSDAVKQPSKPLICCGTVTSCLLLKLSKSGL